MPTTKKPERKSSTQSTGSPTGIQLNRVALALNLSIEKLKPIGWRVEFSGSLLVLHWCFARLFGVPE